MGKQSGRRSRDGCRGGDLARRRARRAIGFQLVVVEFLSIDRFLVVEFVNVIDFLVVDRFLVVGFSIVIDFLVD